MADEKTDDNENAKANDAPVANLHVSQIIAALHQNAVEKCKELLGDKFRIVNSAVDESGNKAVLISQGQQIVSVMPTDTAVKNKIELASNDAVSILKTYVQWFVGPDLAKKVTEHTVKALSESPNEDKSAADVFNAKDKNNLHDMEESKVHFIKFSHFLHEAEEAASGSESESSPKETKSDSKNASDKQSSEKKPEEQEKRFTDRDQESFQTGYYITYDLKVEGMKKTSKINDSKKSLWRSVASYLMNFFDDVKFTARGWLGGGGDSFTVKDVKDSMRQTFGPIDPDELVRNVEERLEKIFKGSSPHATVKVQDKRTLVSDLGPNITSKEKRQIENASYSLLIKVSYDDPKKQILNKVLVADIVQASIKGLFKKFKNRISVHDVIFIENFKDVHGNTEQIRKLYHSVPIPNDIQMRIDKARDVNDAVSKIEKMFDKIKKDNDRSECERADRCWKLWQDFFDKNNLGDRNAEISKIRNGTKQFEKFFQTFIDKYAEVFKKTEDKALNESCSNACFMVANSHISNMLIESMFGSSHSWISEDDSNEGSSKSKFKTQDAVDYAKHYLRNDIFKGNFNSSIQCGPKDYVKQFLKFFDIPDAFNRSSMKNAIAVIPSGKSSSSANKTLNESMFKKDLFSLLFEKDDDSFEDISAKKSSAKKKKVNLVDVSEAEVEKALRRALEDAGAVQIGEFMSLKMKALNEAKGTQKKTIDYEKLTSHLINSLSNYLTKKIDGKQRKDSGGALGRNNQPIAVAKTEDIIKYLKENGLGNESDYERLDKSSSCIFITYPGAKNLKTSKGKLKQTSASSPGFTLFKNNPSIIRDDILKKNLNILGDVSFFTIRGKPVNDSLKPLFGINHRLVYDKTDVIPECLIYLASFDLENGNISDIDDPSPGPGPSEDDEEEKTEIIQKDAYVLMFGDEEIIPVELKDPAVDDENEIKRNDLYIIPMAGLKYEDPEYANKNLKL